AADTLVNLASIVSSGAMLVLSANAPAALAYYPYPRLTLPPLDAAMLLAIVALIAPVVGWSDIPDLLRRQSEGLGESS
ncbi:MAG TPA: hypothetical protein VJ754_05445, partial [Anaerolineae bacterium]|nr:hypothetical protein [Anaerolineae bacterium]